MKSNRVRIFPPVIEDLGDGTYYYNFDVVTSETEDKEVRFDYEQVRCEFPVVIEAIEAALATEGYVHNVDLSGYEEI